MLVLKALRKSVIKVAQTAYLTEAIHEAATSSGEEAFSVQISD